MRSLVLAVVILAGFARSGSAAPIALFADFIPDGSRTAFADFEEAPDTTDLAQPWIEDGLRFIAMGAGGTDIWTTCTGVAPTCQAFEGARSWYHTGGDNGFTQITRDGGGNFESIGMLVSSGFFDLPVFINYATLQGGAVNLTGSFQLDLGGAGYLGFSGGGFDEVLLSATMGAPGSPTSGAFQALQIDSVETLGTAVPEPASLLLLLGGLLGAGVNRRRSLRA